MNSLGRVESTHIGNSTNESRDDDWMTPRDYGRSLKKLELEDDLEDLFFKMEFENSVSSETDASFDYKFTVFPKSLNPGFDLMCVIKVSLIDIINFENQSFSTEVHFVGPFTMILTQHVFATWQE